jgi:hypothetical protein
VNLFYILWGFNYQQASAHRLLGLDPVGIDSVYIRETFIEQTGILNSLAASAKNVPPTVETENALRKIQEKLIQSWGFRTWGRVRVRRMFGGFLLHFRTTGIYIPHVLEGHFDGGIYYKQYPFTMAHEMAHGYGFTDESVCNFVAYVTCMASDDPYVVYSAELAYWRYLSGYFRYFFEDEWDQLYGGLHPVIKDDLTQIKAHIENYTDWMPKYRDIIYDQYLKSHGVKAGIRSYNEMILLIAAYRNNASLRHSGSD